MSKVPFDRTYPLTGLYKDESKVDKTNKIQGIGTEYILYTSLRKKGEDGKWYLVNLVEVYKDTDGRGMPFSFFSRFHAIVYNHIIRFRVTDDSLNLRNSVDNSEFVRLDPFQTDELERMNMIHE